MYTIQNTAHFLDRHGIFPWYGTTPHLRPSDAVATPSRRSERILPNLTDHQAQVAQVAQVALSNMSIDKHIVYLSTKYIIYSIYTLPIGTSPQPGAKGLKPKPAPIGGNSL